MVVTVPSGWQSAPANRWEVPGKPVAAWSGPGGSSLVVYRTLPVPGGKVSDLSDGLVNRLENMPGLRVVGWGAETVGGSEAARVEVVAPGTGDAFAPTGTGTPVGPEGVELKPTRRVVVSILRDSDTLTLLWHAPESGAEALSASVRDTLASLKVARGTLSTSTY